MDARSRNAFEGSPVQLREAESDGNRDDETPAVVEIETNASDSP